MPYALILKFLGKAWPYIAAILLILCIFGYWKSLTSKIARQETQIVELKVELATSRQDFAQCTSDNQAFKTVVDEQNDALLKLKAKSEAQAKRLTQLAADLTKVNKKYNEVVKTLNDIPWDKLDCQQSVDACYQGLIGSTP